MAKIPTIEQTYYLAVPPGKVFAALTEPKGLTAWFLDSAELDLSDGAPFRFVWRGGHTMKGKVREVRPPRRLELAWIDRFPGEKVFRTVARFELRKRGRGTLLTLTHRGFKSGRKWVALYGAIEAGWAHYLTNLRSVLEHGTDLRSDLDAIT
jgi:uncharacterized protein YndB with AHSA1/START domain